MLQMGGSHHIENEHFSSERTIYNIRPAVVVAL